MSLDWAPHMMRAFEHYGIDPSLRQYRMDRAQSGGLCEACLLHAASDPWPVCDLEKARAKDIEGLGFDIRFCCHCHSAYPDVLDQGAICPACKRRQTIRDEAAWAKARRNRIKGFADGSTVRVPDGLGCTERVPKWMVDWDGDPGHREPR